MGRILLSKKAICSLVGSAAKVEDAARILGAASNAIQRFGFIVLGDDVFNHVAEVIREAEVAAIISISQFLMIEAEEREDRRVEVVDVDFVLHRGAAKFVGRSIHRAALYAAACHPRRKRAGIVIASGFLGG